MPALDVGTDDSAPASDYRRRPGPFGPARMLLPENQKIETIPESESTASALERLADTGYSQLPVVDSRGHVIGVFSWKSFGLRMSEIYSLKLDLSALLVGDTDLEKAQFIGPDTYIDTSTDWKEVDYVLVGSPDSLVGVLSLSDIHARLNDFAEAFVLLFEIEHEIRDIFRDVYTDDELEAVLRRLSQGSTEPEARAADNLQQLIEGDAAMLTEDRVVTPIRKALNLLRKASQPRPMGDLADLTYGHYRSVIFHSAEWPRFEHVFDTGSSGISVAR
jgi:CBS domain-containing protein